MKNIFLVIAPKIIEKTAPIISSSLLQRNKLPEAVVKTKYIKKTKTVVAKNDFIGARKLNPLSFYEIVPETVKIILAFLEINTYFGNYKCLFAVCQSPSLLLGSKE